MNTQQRVRPILDALCFDGRPYSLGDLDADALDFTDRSQLTLLLARFDLPPAARQRVDAAVERNIIRVARVAAAYDQIASAFDHVVLKGFTHVPAFVDDLRLRVQYDLDLYVPEAHIPVARDVLFSLGYEPITGLSGLAMDHLPTMIRKTGWEWRGDYFDPGIPVSVEVHFQFWDPLTERLYPVGLDGFWTRRDGHRLHPVDALGYAALHLTRHLLRGNVRPFHVWEIARFVHTQHDNAFWQSWKEWHSPSLRRLEAVAFLLARRWFACNLPQVAEEAAAALPESTRRWFEAYGWAPFDGLFRPNKHELWLHLSLAESGMDRMSILRRRLFPASLPGPVDAVHIPDERMTLPRRIRKQARYMTYASSRAFLHTRLLAPTLWEGFRWWSRMRS
jgi:hypothetical protein